MRIVVINHVTLDGVMQGPGRPDEDTRGGFTPGGWAEPNTDDVMGRAWGKRLAASGRRTYQDLLALDLPPGGGHRGYAAMVDGSGLVVGCWCSHSMGGR
jgi:hypothetical protein